MKETKRTNADGTCLWCGRRLGWECDTKTAAVDRRLPRCPDHGDIRTGPTVAQLREAGDSTPRCPVALDPEGRYRCGLPLELTRRRIIERRRLHEKPGLRGEGHFCTGACSAAFGRAAARNGYRFKPEE